MCRAGREAEHQQAGGESDDASNKHEQAATGHEHGHASIEQAGTGSDDNGSEQLRSLLRSTLLELVDSRTAGATCCPSEVRHALQLFRHGPQLRMHMNVNAHVATVLARGFGSVTSG